jgi:hypothetical protein
VELEVCPRRYAATVDVASLDIRIAVPNDAAALAGPSFPEPLLGLDLVEYRRAL